MATRLDLALVRRGLARSRGDARDLIRTGAVLVDGAVATRAALGVVDDTEVRVAREGPAWVSRAGEKLDRALIGFGPDGLQVSGRRCLDVGASTGGFTQVLLHHGAREVVALDVGTDQLSERLRADPRVVDVSGTTVRNLDSSSIGGPVDLLVADLSFISLTLVLPTMRSLVVDDGDLVVLVKPQFEVGRSEIGKLGKRGVVRSPAGRARALSGVIDAAQGVGLQPRGLVRSTVPGGEGNIEYLLWMATSPAVGMTWQALRATVEDLAAEGK